MSATPDDPGRGSPASPRQIVHGGDRFDDPRVRDGRWIRTASGRRFWPLDPRAGDVAIRDIGHALGHVCRYSGHVRRFYSVAEHSVLVSRAVPPEDALWALLHDASEAYLPDVTSPIKAAFEGFAEIEGRVMRAVAARFALKGEEPDSVRDADRRIRVDESRALMPMPVEEGLEPLGVRIEGLPPEDAAAVFFARFEELAGPPIHIPRDDVREWLLAGLDQPGFLLPPMPDYWLKAVKRSIADLGAIEPWCPNPTAPEKTRWKLSPKALRGLR